MTDRINPPHYQFNGFEAIDVIEAVCGLIDDSAAAVLHGNALKYLLRAPRKNGVEDLKKARWYIEREIARMESATQNNLGVSAPNPKVIA